VTDLSDYKKIGVVLAVSNIIYLLVSDQMNHRTHINTQTHTQTIILYSQTIINTQTHTQTIITNTHNYSFTPHNLLTSLVRHLHTTW